MTNDFPRLILDANIMVSALLGRSFPFLLRLFEAGVQLFAPVQQLVETRHVLMRRPGLTASWVDGQMARLHALVMPLHPALLDDHEAKARSRLGARGQADWPVLAATYATGGAAWSHDRDLFGTGAPVWSTKVLVGQMDAADAYGGDV